MCLKGTYKIVLLLAGLAQLAAAQEVLHHPDASQPLNQRWTWAVEQSGQASLKKGYWIGYSIERLMEENSTIGSMHIKNGRVYRGPGKSLSELIHGIEMPLEVSTHSEAKSERKVMKEVGIFFGYTYGNHDLIKIHESTFSLSVDFKGLPLLWLGEADDEQSLALIEQLYRKASASNVKEDLIAAAGLHGETTRRRTFLTGILTSDETANIRKQAAFWLGQSDDPEALRILRQTAKADRSIEVRKQAVFAMSQMHLTEADDALFELARDQNEREVCKEAIFWLAQKGSERAAAFLKETIYKGTDTEIQKHAVFALTQLPHKQGTPVLLDLAENHQNTAVRKEAIFWLAQQASEKAVALLKDTIYKDDDTEIQKQAIFALTQLPHDDGVPVLIDIAEKHKNPTVRKEAIFWLGQSDDPRATAALLKIVRGE
jgi:HEAT repeat protein